MHIPFNEIKDHARVWIYTSPTTLTPEEEASIKEMLLTFTAQWQSHQKDVLASFTILEKRFVVIAADEMFSDISGCGIDKAMHAIQEIGAKINLSLTEKSFLLFEKNGGILQAPLQNIKQLFLSGDLGADDLYFNTLVTNVEGLKNQFKIPVKDSWLKKYLQVSV